MVSLYVCGKSHVSNGGKMYLLRSPVKGKDLVSILLELFAAASLQSPHVCTMVTASERVCFCDFRATTHFREKRSLLVFGLSRGLSRTPTPPVLLFIARVYGALRHEQFIARLRTRRQAHPRFKRT